MTAPNIPTARERRALENAEGGGAGGESEAKLYVGQKTIEQCIAKGWLERLPDSLIGLKMHRVTDKGRAALARKLPPKKKRPTISMLGPRVTPLEKLKRR
ncbi:MAG: hypothetical protein M9932_02090 [Xanthobacteraceae bacterium]|nr:hypothetical protein [Xanthobacteraceae bacterium]